MQTTFLFLFFLLKWSKKSFRSSLKYFSFFSWNSLCRPGWPRTQKSACLCFPSAGIKGVCHHARLKYFSKTFSPGHFLFSLSIFSVLPRFKKNQVLLALEPSLTASPHPHWASSLWARGQCAAANLSCGHGIKFYVCDYRSTLAACRRFWPCELFNS